MARICFHLCQHVCLASPTELVGTNDLVAVSSGPLTIANGTRRLSLPVHSFLIWRCFLVGIRRTLASEESLSVVSSFFLAFVPHLLISNRSRRRTEGAHSSRTSNLRSNNRGFGRNERERS